MKYFYLTIFLLFKSLAIAKGQDIIKSFDIVYEKHYVGMIDNKYEIDLTVIQRESNRFIDRTPNGTLYIEDVFGSYFYTKKHEPIFLKGKFFSNVDDSVSFIDSLVLDELSKDYEFTGRFFLVSKVEEPNMLKGFWLNKKNGAKLPVLLREKEKQTGDEGRAELANIRINNCYIVLPEATSSTILWSLKKDNKKYILIESAVPHCGQYQSFGECCGGDDTYWYFYEIDKEGNSKKISQEQIENCSQPATFSDEEIKAESLFFKSKTKSLNLQIKNPYNLKKILIDGNFPEKGIQVLEKTN